MSIEDEVTRQLRASGFEASLSAATEDAYDLHVRAFSEGLHEALEGLTIIAARGDIWDGDGHWSIELLLSDGSSLDVPGHCFAHGPLADLVRMAGGFPDGNPEDHALADSKKFSSARFEPWVYPGFTPFG